MNKLSLIAKKTFNKDIKTLIKAGVLDDSLEVRDSKQVMAFIVDKFTAELAAVAQAQLDEAKAESSK